MKEYTRRVTGVISNYSCCPYVDNRRVDDIVVEMIGKDCTFAGTISIVITDLTEDSGAVQEEAPVPNYREAKARADKALRNLAELCSGLPAAMQQPAAETPAPDAPAALPEKGRDAE